MNARGNKVQLSSTGGDSIAIGRARVKLKLAALAFASAHHGGDKKVERMGVQSLSDAAIRYYEALCGKQPGNIVDTKMHVELGGFLDDSVASDWRARLKLAALAYTSARSGVDANLEIARAGLAVLCEASIRYCEVLDPAPRRGPINDPSLHLDSGAV